MAIPFSEKLVNLSPIYQILTPISTTVASLGLFENNYGRFETTAVGREEVNAGLIPARSRAGERNYMQMTPETIRTFLIPFFPLDKQIKPADVQNFRAWLNDPTTALSPNDMVVRTMQQMRRHHALTKEKIFTEALFGRSYVGPNGNTNSLYNYYDEYGVAATPVNIDFTADRVDPSTILELEARAAIYDAKGTGTGETAIVALCGRRFFQNVVNNAYFREAFLYTPSAQEPLRNRINGNADAQNFVYRGITYVEDIHGNVPQDEAIVFPTDIPGMFKAEWAPSDTIEDANQVAEEEYMFMEEERRYIKLESEFALLAVNTRPELCIRVTSTSRI